MIYALFFAIAACWSAVAFAAPDEGMLRNGLRKQDVIAITKRQAFLDQYDLNLTMHSDLRGFELNERIQYQNRGTAPDETVWLRIFANETGPAPVPVRMQSVSCAPIACETLSDQRSLVVLKLARPLEVSERLEVSANLTGTLTEGSAQQASTMAQLSESLAVVSGKGSGDYGLLSYGDGIASLTHFYAEIAAKNQGQWVGPDESPIGDRGTDLLRHVRVRVQTSKENLVVATGEERSVADGQWEISAPAIRDLTILMSPEFVAREARVGQVRVRAFTIRKDQAQLAALLDVSVHALKAFEKRFGPYPYRELDLVEAPVRGGAAGVEFSGLATVSTGLLGEQDPMGGLLSSLSGEHMASRESVREMVIAHEVAHQYWHGLIGSSSRRSPVLDESLAQYSALLYFEDRYGRARAELEAERQVKMNYLGMRMLGGSDAEADRQAQQFETGVAYAGLVYGKAPFAFEALRKQLGATALFRALKRYAQANRFKEATRDDLIHAFAPGPERQRAETILARYFDERFGDEDLGVAAQGQEGLSGLLFDALGAGANEGDAGGLGGLLSGFGALQGFFGEGSGSEGLDLNALLQALKAMQEGPTP